MAVVIYWPQFKQRPSERSVRPRYTGHSEVRYPADKPKLGELKLLTVDPEELEKRSEEIRKRFVEFFGA